MKVQDGENIIHEMRPEPQILVIWFFTKCLAAAFAGMFFMFAFSGIFGGIFAAFELEWTGSLINIGFARLATIAILFLVLFLTLALLYCKYLRRTYVYYITNRRCVFHGGIIRRVERSIPYHKVTDVEISQNIIERILGISSLRIFTPGTGSMMATPFGGQRAEIEFVGLKDSQTPAEAINELLRKFINTGE